LVESADDARHGDHGGLADLVTTEYPDVRLSHMALAPATRAQLARVLHEQRRRDVLASHGFAPLHRLLFTGPPGTGKSLTASALATELSLPLVTIRIEALISKYTGETALKLRVIFDAMARPRSVYLFDELDAIGARQMAGTANGMAGNDIVDARRVLQSALRAAVTKYLLVSMQDALRQDGRSEAHYSAGLAFYDARSCAQVADVAPFEYEPAFLKLLQVPALHRVVGASADDLFGDAFCFFTGDQFRMTSAQCLRNR
jgi:hypothetical protein